MFVIVYLPLIRISTLLLEVRLMGMTSYHMHPVLKRLCLQGAQLLRQGHGKSGKLTIVPGEQTTTFE